MRLRTRAAALPVAATCLLVVGVLTVTRPGTAEAEPDGYSLVSVAPGGGTALGDSVGADLADGGRWVAFQSRAAGSPWRIHVRDLLAGSTVQLDPAAAGDATAPSISADGRLVSFVVSTPEGARVHVVDRDTDADGVFDQPGRTAVHQVTGTPTDLPYQRVQRCAEASNGHEAQVACPPRLAAGGRAITLPVELNPDSPRLTFGQVTADPDPVLTRLVDFGLVNGDTAGREIRVEVSGSGPVSFGAGPTLRPGAGALFEVGSTTCVSTLIAPTSCAVTVEFHAERCAAQGDRTRLGVLALRTDVPGVHGELGLVGECGEGVDVPKPPTAPCAARSAAGLDVTAVPAAPGPSGTAVSDLGALDLGQRILTTVPVANPSAQAVPVAVWGGRPCDFQLALPDVPEPGATPCQPGQPLAAGATCTAYVLVAPTSVGRTVGSVSVAATVGARLVVTGTSQLAVVRTDPSGGGDFAGADRPAPRVASVSSGGVALDARQAVISADGRAVAFTSQVQLDGQPAGLSRTRVHLSTYTGSPPRTVTVAVDAAPSGSAGPLTEAAAPAISADGGRVAFTASDGGPLQVYAHDVASGATVLVSRRVDGSTGGDSFSDAPDLSADGGTVAYTSSAGNLVEPAVPGPPDARVYVRQLEADFTGAGRSVNEIAAPAGSRRPALDTYGNRVVFQTSAAVGGGPDGNGTDDVYLFRRDPDPGVAPGALDFGAYPVGAASPPQAATLTNAGAGPLVVDAVLVDGPFRVLTDECLGRVLGPRGQCVVQVEFTPRSPGTTGGVLRLVVGGAAEAEDQLVTLSGTGVAGAAPRVTFRPAVVVTGQVTRVSGAGLPPGSTVELRWEPVGGGFTVTADASGRFSTDVVIMKGLAAGPRRLVAQTLAGPVTFGEVLLVVPGSANPPDFVDR